MKIKDLEGGLKFSAKKSAVDEEALSVSFVALSKDNMHKRSFFGEDYYLSVDTASMQWEAKTLYKDHDVSFETALGKITDVKFENGSFKAKVEFFKDIPESYQAFLKFKNGLSDSVSVGMSDYEISEKLSVDGVSHYEIANGKIYELSAVWQGADPNAKIANFNKNQKQGEVKMNPETNPEVAELTAKNTELQKRADENKQIIELAQILGESEKGLEAINNGVSFNAFSKQMAELSKSAKYESINVAPKATDKREFSLANIIKSSTGIRTDLGYENSFIQDNGRYALPDEFYAKFAAVKTTDATSIIDRAYRSDLLIEALKQESELLNKVTWLTGLSQEVEIPRDNSAFEAYFVNEGDQATPQNLDFDTIKLSSHTLSARIAITRKMLLMSAIDLESYIYSKFRDAIRSKLEDTLIHGTTPIKGIFNTSGVQTHDGFIAAPTLESTLKFSTLLDSAKIDTTRAVFFANGASLNKLRATSRESGTERKLLEGNDLQGYEAFKCNKLADGELIFADFSQLYAATFGQLEFIPRQIGGGSIEIEVFLEVDAKIAREKAFVISKNA
ncbi:phage major capsid protein [Campylobacter suis]|uniref:Phage capsid-like C-terminal domain-containing protein n=1 Tax=Campylobacter suis TaxID=2790657 RepID=A0ABM8Q5S6_9BACT|nr:phage major capsid protein [Campylobacter suis]CAD7288239.1 hypothetical protein LMG8286_01207 [Campylobacter suis]